MTEPKWILAARNLLKENGVKNPERLTEDELRFMLDMNYKAGGFPTLEQVQAEIKRRNLK
jgi:hypothetical protein